MPTVIVSGALANKPFNGGNAWTRVSWACGFRRLGFDVWFVEQIDARACVGDDGKPAPFERSANRAYFRRVVERFELGATASLLYHAPEEERTEGVDFDRLVDACDSADLLFNISGHLSLPALKRGPRLRVYFDDDPGYTQFWHAAGTGGARLEGHDAYYTVGQNVGTPGCPVPTAGVPWRHTLPPVVLEDWPVVRTARTGPSPFTTVASWRGPYGPVQYEGTTYGLKAHEFRKFAALPRTCDAAFEVALDIHPSDAKDLALLKDNGWRIADPRAVAAEPDHFRRYVQSSGAEFSAAQGIYVQTNSGWFSDRTTRYLASGKPALVQDTGFGRHLVAGGGVVPFTTPDEARAGTAEITARYDEHCHAARAVAEEYFDSDKVVGRLLDGLKGLKAAARARA
jgi:hypothetical protein